MIFLFLVFCVSIGFEVPATEHVPRVLPKDEDPSLVKRNRRMLGQLLGTLEVLLKLLLSLPPGIVTYFLIYMFTQ